MAAAAAAAGHTRSPRPRTRERRARISATWRSRRSSAARWIDAVSQPAGQSTRSTRTFVRHLAARVIAYAVVALLAVWALHLNPPIARKAGEVLVQAPKAPLFRTHVDTL